MFRKTDLGRIILANTFYDVLDTAQVPDGEGAPGWTTQGVKESSDNHRKVNVSKIVKDKTHNLKDELLPQETHNGAKINRFCK